MIGVSTQARTCLFCGRLGSSREHIVPQWIGRAFDVPSIPDVDIVNCHRSENPAAGIGLREKRAKGPAYYTRAFCERCNNGWMSALEEKVRPLLEPLLHGEPRRLGPDDQELLALWATKTILAFQSIEEPSTTWARPGDCHELFTTQRPLANSQVWLGCTVHGSPAWYRAHTIRLRGSAEDAVDGFGATLTVGHAVFYFVLGFAGAIGMRLRYEPASALREIWPGGQREVDWPPRLALMDEQPQALPEYLARHCVLATT